MSTSSGTTRGSIIFEWDIAKARRNLEVHGVAFEEAAEAFGDPNLLYVGQATIHGEVRDHVLAGSGSSLLLFIAHTITPDHENEVIRIISARRATRAERKFYGSYGF